MQGKFGFVSLTTVKILRLVLSFSHNSFFMMSNVVNAEMVSNIIDPGLDINER